MENIKNYIAKNQFREFESAQELVRHWSKNPIVWSWGAHAWKLIDGKVLRFTVNGHHHKGHVYIMVNGSDLFDVFLTSSQGNIKKVINDVYLEDVTEVIDIAVEKIDKYNH
jgi:hypothetical protein